MEKNIDMKMHEFIKPYFDELKAIPLFKNKKGITQEQFMDDLQHLQCTLREIATANRSVFKKCLKEADRLLDFVLFEHVSLLTMLHRFHNVRTRKAVGKPKESRSFKALQSFTFLLNNAINNLISIKALLPIGMDVQTRVLFRNYMETMEMSYAILLDEEFLLWYLFDPENEHESKKKYYQTKPSKVLAAIERGMEKFSFLDGLWQLIRPVRDSFYSIASLGIHVDRIAVAYASYPTQIGADTVCRGFGGAVSKATASTIYNLVDYSRVLVHYSLVLLVGIHDLPLGKFKQAGVYHTFVTELVKAIHQDDLQKRCDR